MDYALDLFETVKGLIAQHDRFPAWRVGDWLRNTTIVQFNASEFGSPEQFQMKTAYQLKEINGTQLKLEISQDILGKRSTSTEMIDLGSSKQPQIYTEGIIERGNEEVLISGGNYLTRRRSYQLGEKEGTVEIFHSEVPIFGFAKVEANLNGSSFSHKVLWIVTECGRTTV